MMMTAILTAIAMMTAPVPTFDAPCSIESADTCMELAVNSQYIEGYDYDGDGVLSVMDAVAIGKRGILNSTYGNTYTFGEKEVMAVVEENLNPSEYSDYFYYEIDFIDGVPCREYEISTDGITEVHVYCEVNDNIFQFTARITAVEESFVVTD